MRFAANGVYWLPSLCVVFVFVWTSFDEACPLHVYWIIICTCIRSYGVRLTTPRIALGVRTSKCCLWEQLHEMSVYALHVYLCARAIAWPRQSMIFNVVLCLYSISVLFTPHTMCTAHTHTHTSTTEYQPDCRCRTQYVWGLTFNILDAEFVFECSSLVSFANGKASTR